MAIITGKSLGARVAEALGLGGLVGTRIVLDFPARGVVRVYFEGLPSVDEEGLLSALRDLKAAGQVDVIPCHEITITPPPEPQCGVAITRRSCSPP